MSSKEEAVLSLLSGVRFLADSDRRNVNETPNLRGVRQVLKSTEPGGL